MTDRPDIKALLEKLSRSKWLADTDGEIQAAIAYLETPPPGECGCRLHQIPLWDEHGESWMIDPTDCLYADTLSKNTTLIRSLDLVSQALKESEIERDDALERGRVLEELVERVMPLAEIATWNLWAREAKQALQASADD